MNRTRASFKSLGEELRYRIYRVLLLSNQALAVCELVDILMRPQYAVSRALSGLKQARLVGERPDGKMNYYYPASFNGEQNLRDYILGSEDSTGTLELDKDRLKWRLDIRINDRCIITYPVERDFQHHQDIPEPKKVLFVGARNSTCSQLAEEYLRHMGGDAYHVESAGLEPGELNPEVVSLLQDEGIRIKGKQTKSVFDLYHEGKNYDLVIPVFNPEIEKSCPVFPNPVKVEFWSFPDSPVKDIAVTIRQKIKDLIKSDQAKY